MERRDASGSGHKRRRREHIAQRFVGSAQGAGEMAGVVAGTYFGHEEGRADGFSDCGGLEHEPVDGVWAGEETGRVAGSWTGIVLAERR